MPRGFMDDLEGEVIGEEVHEGDLVVDTTSMRYYNQSSPAPKTARGMIFHFVNIYLSGS